MFVVTVDEEFGLTQCWWEGSRCSPRTARWAAARLFLSQAGSRRWRADGCSEADRRVMPAAWAAPRPPAQRKICTNTSSVSFKEAWGTQEQRNRGWAYAPGSLRMRSECSRPSCRIPLSGFLTALRGFLLPVNTSTSRAPLFSCTDRNGYRQTGRGLETVLLLLSEWLQERSVEILIIDMNSHNQLLFRLTIN